jgi:hypothetical protein
MVSSKRPPLELDDLTNNLKQSSGKGIGVFFPAQPTLQEAQDTKENQEEAQHPVPPVPVVPPVLPVPVVPPSG